MKPNNTLVDITNNRYLRLTDIHLHSILNRITPVSRRNHDLLVREGKWEQN